MAAQVARFCTSQVLSSSASIQYQDNAQYQLTAAALNDVEQRSNPGESQQRQPSPLA